MRTRRGHYPTMTDGITFCVRPNQQKRIRRQCEIQSGEHASRKRARASGFDALHDDILISIMVAVSSTAGSPADLVNAILVSKRFCVIGTHPQVLARAGISALAVKACAWSEGAQRFLIQCAEAGNIEACYTLGMIRFYCLRDRIGGAALINKAALASHTAALHSLAVIRFNGSEGTRKDKDLRAGAQLCAKAAALGHVDAMREFGHCLQDGYGVKKNVAEGRRFLLEANAREAAAAVAANPRAFVETVFQLARSKGAKCLRIKQDRRGVVASIQLTAVRSAEALRSEALSLDNSVFKFLQGGGYSLLSDFGCNVPPAKLHVSNKFLVDWFATHPPSSGLRLCSQQKCGRLESRRHEFRRCSGCGFVHYCSRACQALDWKVQHKYKCNPVLDWDDHEVNDGEDDNLLAFEDLHES